MTSEQRESITVAVVWSINVHTVICCGPELKSCPQKAARIASMFCLTGWAPLLAKHTKAVSDSQPRSCFWSSNYFKLNHSDSSIFFPSLLQYHFKENPSQSLQDYKTSSLAALKHCLPLLRILLAAHFLLKKSNKRRWEALFSSKRAVPALQWGWEVALIECTWSPTALLDEP